MRGTLVGLQPHPALEIYDIRNEICLQLKFGGYLAGLPAPWKRDLARLARCCVRFSGNALDMLWEELSSVKPILRLAEIYRADLQGGTTASVYNISKCSSRFREYAARIRILHGRNDSDFYGWVSMQPGPDVVFPRLHTLTWLGHPNQLAINITLFLSPSLRCLRIRTLGDRGPADLYALSTFALTLVKSTPLLQELDLAGDMAAIPMDFTAEFHQLRRLTVRPCLTNNAVPTIFVLRELSSRAHLSHLQFRFYGMLAQDITGWTGFPALRSLHAIDAEETLLPHLLDRLTTPDLESFHVSGEMHWKGIQSCIYKLASRFTSSLRHLSVHLDTRRMGQVVSIQTFHPLLRLHQLSHLCIANIGDILSVDDGDFAQFVSAWPKLESLTLGRAQGLTLHCLLSVVDHCPDLSYLELGTVNIQVVPDIETFPVSSHRLTDLKLECAPWHEEKRSVIQEIEQKCFPFHNKSLGLF